MLGKSARAWLGRAFAAAGLARAAGALEFVRLGQSGDLVVRSAAGFFVKAAGRQAPLSVRRLEREARAMTWLAPRVRAPQVIFAGAFDAGFVLVTWALPGIPVSDTPPLEAGAALAPVIRQLAALHAVAIGDCPFDARVGTRLAEAAELVAADLVDADDFDPERRGLSPADVLAMAKRGAPSDEDLVVAHGDASLPNVLYADGRCTGVVDVGHLGVADRHHDIAIFLRSAARNHAHVDARALLQEHYPSLPPDEKKLSYYVLLDELF